MLETDIFFYNGEISRGDDLKFINYISERQQYNKCLLILVTPGGDPDAAYKISRFIQSRYEEFSVLVSGLCKSAGTLMAIGASKLIFSPYGELGPIDIQTVKTDQIMGLESGLNITEAFSTLEDRAKNAYHDFTVDIISRSGGVVSYQTASKAATDLVSALYSPIFQEIEHEEVGERSRAMRVGQDYARRLNHKWANAKPKSIYTLTQSYSTHGFVIDFEEAKELFNQVEMADEVHMYLIEGLGDKAWFSSGSGVTFSYIEKGDEEPQPGPQPAAKPEQAKKPATKSRKPARKPARKTTRKTPRKTPSKKA